MGFFDPTTSATSTLTRGQKRVLKQSGAILERELDRPGAVYQGQVVPGATAGQRTAFGAGANLLSQGANTLPAINQMLSGQTDPAAVNQYYQQALVNPAMQTFGRTMDTMASRYGDTYGQSGGMLRGMGQAATDFNTNLSGQLAGLQFAERNAARDRQGQGVGLALNQQQGYEQTLSQMLGIGGAERSIAGQVNQAAMAKWNAGQAVNNPWLQALFGPVLGTQAIGLSTADPMAKGLKPLG